MLKKCVENFQYVFRNFQTTVLDGVNKYFDDGRLEHPKKFHS